MLYNAAPDSHTHFVEILVPDDEEQKNIRNKIEQLQLEHRDLDDIITRLADQPSMDQLQMRRLKNRKLLIKDIIRKLESQLIPDIDA